MKSKLPNVGTTIFTVMSALAREHNAVNLAQGFPNFMPDKKLIDLTTRAMSEGFNQYAPMPGVPELLEQVAILVENIYGRKVHPINEITVTAGATQAIYTAITAFVHPGDEVIILEPAYDSYIPAIELCGAVVVPYTMLAPDYKVNWSELAGLITDKTRMIIVNTPHNPTGTILRKEDMEQLSDLVVRNNLILVSDEVYEHIVFDGQRHESSLHYPALWERTIAAFSFGKTFHNTGWRLGYVVAPESLMKEFRKVHQYCTFAQNTPMQYALAEYIKDENTYLSIKEMYQNKRNYFAEALANTRLKPLACEGTFFQLADYSAISDEDDLTFAKRLTKEYGVATIPLSPFYTKPPTDSRIIRFCFAKTEETLLMAINKMLEI